MSWVCDICSSNNDDDSDICFVCGNKRSSSRSMPETEELDRTSVEPETVVEVVPRRAINKYALFKAIAICAILVSFAVGQIVLYALYAQTGKVLFLTRFLKASENYDFNTTLYLVITSVIGAVSCVLAALNTHFLARGRKEYCIWLNTIPFCVAMLLCPALNACWVIVFEVVVLIIMKRSSLKIAIAFLLLFAVASLIVLPSVTSAIGETYTITFDWQGGQDGTERKEAKVNSDMPKAKSPVKEGYTFGGYYDSIIGGTQYYDADMVGRCQWDKAENTTLYAHWIPNVYHITLDCRGGTGGTSKIDATYEEQMPHAEAPTMSGYAFVGYYDSITGGTQYYDSLMESKHIWDRTEDATLYAHWTANEYVVVLDQQGGQGGTTQITVTYGQQLPTATAPTKTGFTFNGYYSKENGAGVRYYDAQMTSLREWGSDGGGTLYAYWTSSLRASTASSSLTDISDSKSTTINVSNGSGNYSYATTANGYSGVSVSISGNRITLSKTGDDKSGYITILVSDLVTGATASCSIYYTTTGSCVATGTLITLADGTAVPVETLTGDELLLVWDMETGTFDSAPILFIDYEAPSKVNIIHLYFSDGTEVKVIGEHAFWNFNLNEYVFLRDDAAKYIGHWFNKQNVEGAVLSWTKVQLVNVVFETEYTAAWSPVTYQHLCYYVNGMLSMPGATEGLINLFAVDDEKMMYSADAREADIQEYGLFTYDEFCQIIQVPEEIFEAFNGEYLKIALGKGLISWERIATLLERYKDWF